MYHCRMKNEQMGLKMCSIAYAPKCDVVLRKHSHFAKAGRDEWQTAVDVLYKFWPNDNCQMALHFLVFCVTDVFFHSPLFGVWKYAASG
jgi:hypothetical protein